jgi:hypothetical protein
MDWQDGKPRQHQTVKAICIYRRSPADCQVVRPSVSGLLERPEHKCYVALAPAPSVTTCTQSATGDLLDAVSSVSGNPFFLGLNDRSLGIGKTFHP